MEKAINIESELAAMKKRYEEGLLVSFTGTDESDDICCPVCNFSVARNDDIAEMRPKHCQECGTKLLYQKPTKTECTRNFHHVQIVKDNYDIIHNRKVKEKYPTLYREVIFHDKDNTRSWYDLTNAAYAEYQKYVRDNSIGYVE